MMPTILPFVLVALALTVPTPTFASSSQYTTYSSHTDSTCSSAPKQIAYIPQTANANANDCASNAASCVVDTMTGLYLAKTCVMDPNAKSINLFGSKPWIQFEVYEPNTVCASLASIIAYSADGSCLTVDSGSSSVRALVFTNKSAAIARYDGAVCSGVPTKTNTLTKDQLAKASCISGLLLVSTGNATIDGSLGKSHAVSMRATIASAVMTLLMAVTVVLGLW